LDSQIAADNPRGTVSMYFTRGASLWLTVSVNQRYYSGRPTPAEHLQTVGMLSTVSG